MIGKALHRLIPPDNIPSKPKYVGNFLDAIPLETSMLDPVLTQVITTEGVFVVRGVVSALNKSNVTLNGGDDNR